MVCEGWDCAFDLVCFGTEAALGIHLEWYQRTSRRIFWNIKAKASKLMRESKVRRWRVFRVKTFVLSVSYGALLLIYSFTPLILYSFTPLLLHPTQRLLDRLMPFTPQFRFLLFPHIRLPPSIFSPHFLELLHRGPDTSCEAG